jgi:hypothetical protein
VRERSVDLLQDPAFISWADTIDRARVKDQDLTASELRWDRPPSRLGSRKGVTDDVRGEARPNRLCFGTAQPLSQPSRPLNSSSRILADRGYWNLSS